MNMRDSEFVAGMLFDNGFRKARSMESADVILFNSCSVRKHAEDRLFSNIAALKELKEMRPSLIIGLMGCAAQNYKDKILKRLPMVDLVCGPGNETDLPGMLEEVIRNRCAIVAVDKINEKRPEIFPKYRNQAFKAHVSIGEGCDNFCSYCIVPYVRGRERSRDAKDIIREVKSLAGQGCKEVTLLGQNVNSYKSPSLGQGSAFVKLLEKINRIEGIRRIRFMTSHPKDASRELFKAMKDLDKVCEHLHLPMQSASDRILKLMKRGYTAKKYLEAIELYRKFVPEGSLTTDILVGFPSEKYEDFKKTKDVLEGIGFDSAFAFKYSPRPPARAADLEDDVPKEAKEERLAELLNLQCEISRRRNEPMKGRTIEVLVDGEGSSTPHLLAGRTRTNKMAIFEGAKSLVGRIVNVKIEDITPHTLKGRIIT